MTLATLARLRDDAIPELPSLLLDGSALWAAAGGTEASVRPVQVSWRPGRSLTVRYEASPAPGTGDPVSFVAHAGTAAPPDAGTTVVESELGRVAVWRLADDPWLPGLRVALVPDRVRGLLGSLGVPAAPIHLALRAYRPGRRAVVECRTGAHRLFLKVLRPDRIEGLQDRHRAFQAALPVPATHGWAPDLGLIVLAGLPGRTLREAMATSDPVPTPERLRALLARLPAPPDGVAVRSQVRAGLRQGDLLTRLLEDDPAEAHARALLADLRPRVEASRDARHGRVTGVHGDFHPAQVLIEHGDVSGLLDVDTAGLGDPLDDWATLVAHLEVAALTTAPEERRTLDEYVAETTAMVLGGGLGAPISSEDLDVRVAAVIVGLSTGPFRVQAPDWPAQVCARLRLAERRASGLGRGEADKSGFIAGSALSQARA